VVSLRDWNSSSAFLKEESAMTTVVMNDTADHSESDRVLVTLNCKTKYNPLGPDNRLYEALYGLSVIRVNLEIDPAFCYPSDDPSDSLLIALSNIKDIPVSQLRNLAKSPEQLSALAISLLREQFTASCRLQGAVIREQDVNVVLCEATFSNQGSLLRDILKSAFSNARYFIAGLGTNNYPYEIEPLCKDCSQPMRRAGTVFVCEHCGSVSS
jgi:hypothetical protein